MKENRDLCRGWDLRSVNRLLAEVSDRQRRLLEVLAERAVVSLKEIAEEMGEPEATVTGVLGSLGNRTKDYGIVDNAGNPTWPFYIEWDSSESLRLPDAEASRGGCKARQPTNSWQFLTCRRHSTGSLSLSPIATQRPVQSVPSHWAPHHPCDRPAQPFADAPATLNLLGGVAASAEI